MKRHQVFAAILLYFNLVASLKAIVMPNVPGAYTDPVVSLQISNITGSGFILQASNSMYLVTARHVLYADYAAKITNPANWHLWSTQAVVSGYYTPYKTNSLPFTLELNLTRLDALKDVRCSIAHDVALVRIQDCDPSNHYIIYTHTDRTQFTSSNQNYFVLEASAVCKTFDSVAIGSDIMTFGFPNSIGLDNLPQIDRNLPLLRKGIVAGINHSRKVFVLDAHSNTTVANSGYSIAEPIDVALEMVWQ